MYENKQNKHGKYQCPCCGYYTFDELVSGLYAICSVCYWEDERAQLNDPDYKGGANKVSLNRAKENFKKYRAVEKRFIKNVRKPNVDEV